MNSGGVGSVIDRLEEYSITQLPKSRRLERQKSLGFYPLTAIVEKAKAALSSVVPFLKDGYATARGGHKEVGRCVSDLTKRAFDLEDIVFKNTITAIEDFERTLEEPCSKVYELREDLRRFGVRESDTTMSLLKQRQIREWRRALSDAEATHTYAVEITDPTSHKVDVRAGTRRLACRLLRDVFADAKRELWSLLGFLADADATLRRTGDKTVGQWVSEIVELAYEFEDLVFLTYASSQNGSGEEKVRRLRSRMSALKEALESHSVRQLEEVGGDREREIREWRRDYSEEVGGGAALGLEGDVEDLLEILTKEAHRVVCLWGMGGIGKTTLGREIYGHDRIRSHFEGFAWVSLSGDSWRTFEEARERPIDILLEEVVAKLTAADAHKCLVVVDDVWTKSQWSSIENVLVAKLPKAKVVVTTRNRDLSESEFESESDPSQHPNSHVFFHQLRCLDMTHSLVLLQNVTGEDQWSDEKKEVGEKMLRYCGGLPLAIALLGKHLSPTHTAYEWEEIFHRDFMRDSIRREDETGTGHKLRVLGDVLWILSLSYIELPHHLRRCFLYLAHIPSDFELRVEDLCQVYDAETSVQMFHNPYECFEELVKMSMVHVGKFDFEGKIRTLHLHSLIAELCSRKAKEENFVQIIENVNDNVGVPSYRGPPRIAVYLNKDVARELRPLIKGGKDKSNNVQSIMCFTRLPYPSFELEIGLLLSWFPRLRVLKFEGLTEGYFGNLPPQIGDLVHLRYLSLKGSHVEKLPSSIGKLSSLQALDLRTKWTVEIPSEICNLNNLRHLYLSHRSCVRGNKKLMFGGLTSLRTLVNVPLQLCDVDDFKRLIQLTKLKFHVSEKWWKKSGSQGLKFDLLRSVTVENLSQPRIHLMSLISSWGMIKKLHLQGRIDKLPEHDSLPELMKLSLDRTDLEDDAMAVLEKLPKLSSLVLSRNAFKGTKMVCSAGGFSQLQSLSLFSIEHLKEWTIGKGAFPNLSYLLIEYCYALKSLPTGLRDVTSLNKLVIKSMPWEFQMKLTNCQDSYKHVQHIDFLDNQIECSENQIERTLTKGFRRTTTEKYSKTKAKDQIFSVWSSEKLP